MAKRKNKGGRPTKFTSDTVRKLEEALSIGASVSEAALFAGISRQSLYEWCKVNPRFSDRIEHLQARPVLQARMVVHNAIAAGDVDTAAWYLERKRLGEFGRSSRSAQVRKSDDEPLPKLVRFIGSRVNKHMS